MIPVVKRETIYNLDKKASQTYHLAPAILMERAGLAIYQRMKQDGYLTKKRHITLVVYPGNNGGDGLVLARELKQAGHDILLISFEENNRKSPLFQENLLALQAMQVPKVSVKYNKDLKDVNVFINCSDMIIDALFGVGLNRRLSPLANSLINLCNQNTNCIKISIDLPSGLDGDTGLAYGNVFCADHTYTLVAPKLGFYLKSSERYLGKLTICSIGLPKELIDTFKTEIYYLTEHDLKKYFPKRYVNGHKGSYGHLGLVMGSRSMLGALLLASKSAMHMGLGKLSTYLSEKQYSDYMKLIPEAIAHLHDTPLKDFIENVNCLVCGCGLGLGNLELDFVKTILACAKKSVVLDADALTLVVKHHLNLAEHHAKDLVITPHPKEFARLIDKDVNEVLENRVSLARHFAIKNHLTVVLKGENTLIATQDGKIYINSLNASVLSKAGSGDALAGMIGSLLARGMSAKRASIVAVMLHGKVAQLVEKNYGAYAGETSQLIRMVGKYLRYLEKKEMRRFYEP